jgi:hypothetical protein
MARYAFALLIILLAVCSRLLPHPPNFAPITALALFGAVYLGGRYAFIVPLAALLISDLIIGLYAEMVWVYGSFLIIGLIGLWLRNHRSVTSAIGATVGGSVLFFLLTNFGVWLVGHGTYAASMSGLLTCYTAAIPFFRNTLTGDLFYVTAMFGVYELGRRYVPILRSEPGPAKA